MWKAIVAANLDTGFSVILLKDMDVDPERYEILEKHPAKVMTVKHQGRDLTKAIDYFCQLLKELTKAESRR